VSGLTVTQILAQPGALRVAFQPVFDIRDREPRPHAFEALSRGAPGTGLESAVTLFERARAEGGQCETDRLCIEAILGSLEGVAFEGDVTLNVHASTLGGDRGFVEFLAEAAARRRFSMTRLIVEVLEHDRPADGALFAQALQGLRGRGVRIALDDVGLGLSNYQMMLDCDADYLKVDRCLVMDCDRDVRRRAVLDSVFLLGGRLGSRVIAEGVETAGELATLVSLGIELAQGFLLSRPLPAAALASGGAGPFPRGPFGPAGGAFAASF
jgi:EAL domain-containing protein (putative c-di-GMP-specific phosphodiesterase class I)